MKSAPLIRFAVPALLALCILAPAVHAERPKGKAWTSLFNGKDLSGWALQEGVGDEAKGIWTVVDGVIDCNPRIQPRGDKSLYSEKEYGDFALHLEWRIKETRGEYAMPIVLPDGSLKTDENGKVIKVSRPNADSGIYLRGTGKAQVNIWCWPVGSGEVYGYRNDRNQPAKIRAGVTPKVKADRPVGEWNTFLITMRGDRLTVKLNDQVVLRRAALPGVPEKGKIALQHHGGYDEKKDQWNGASSLVQFREIYIKELKPRKKDGKGKKARKEKK